jgi:hypothetical protein
MAGTHPFLRKLRGLLKVVDDEVLVSLANRGLLRRAQKDLDSASPAILAVEDGLVQVQMADATVDARELPSKCTCSCPATGICRHILSALLYLRDSADLAECDEPVQVGLFGDDTAAGEVASEAIHSAEVHPAPAEILGNLSDQELQKWAGKPLLRKALKTLAADPPVEIDAAESLVVRFPTRNITCRWIPSGGLLGMICSCQAANVCEHVVTAILAYQVSLGRRQITVEQAALTESSGAPRTRAEVLASVGTVLREMLSLGLARLSAATAQRLTTLAVSAHGVDLPRMERMLKTLADEVQLALRRDAQSSSANLVAQAARIEALRTALEKNASAALVGQHRTQYHEVGQITLIGLGAQRWRSKGGYQGVTVYFWDNSRKSWATWSDSRPVTQPGFDPAGRFRGDGPWDGCRSPQEAAESVLRLSHAHRNPQGRISGRSATRALVVGPSQPRNVPVAIAAWSELAERAKRIFGSALGERHENSEIVLLAPRAWGPPLYDTLRQELVRPMADEAGRNVNLWLPFTPENEAGVEFLERHDPSDTHGLLGAMRLVAGQICVQPISLYVEDRIVHLTLLDPKGASAAKTAKKASGAKAAAGSSSQAAEVEDELVAGEDEETVSQAAATTPLSRILITVQAELEALIEGGIAARRSVDLLHSAAKRLDALGLTACARPLAATLQALDAAAQRGEPAAWNTAAGWLLRAYYATRLAADFEMIEIACQGLK